MGEEEKQEGQQGEGPADPSGETNESAAEKDQQESGGGDQQPIGRGKKGNVRTQPG